MTEGVSRETNGLKFFRLQAEVAADVRLRKLAKLSENWPDPTARRKLADLKPIYVHNPETARLVEAAKAAALKARYPGVPAVPMEG